MPYPLLIPACFLALGIYLGTFSNTISIAKALFIITFIFLIIFSYFRSKLSSHKITVLFAITLWSTFFSLGLLNGGILHQKEKSLIILPDNCLNKPEQWLIKLETAPKRKIRSDGSVHYQSEATILGGRCLAADQLLPISIQLTLPDGHYPSSGQISVLGRLSVIHPNYNFGVYDFSREGLLNGRHYRLSAVAAAALTENKSIFTSSLNLLADLRAKYGQILLNNSPTADSGQIAQAMILGLREQQNPQLKSRHAAAGTSHLLAISGLHVGFALSLIFFIFRFVFSIIVITPRLPAQRLAAAATIIFLIIYVIFTGAAWSTLRAGIMAFMLFSSLMFNRSATGINNLAIAALIILIIDPAALFSPGFMLSFSAAAGLLISHHFLNWKPGLFSGRFGHIFYYFWQLLLVSIVATLATAPLSSHYFQQTSLWGPLASMLTIPISALAVALGTIGVIIYPISSFVGSIMAIGADWLCWFIDFIVIKLTNIATPTLPAIAFNWTSVILYYATFFLLMNYHHRICKHLGSLCFILLLSNFAIGHFKTVHHEPTVTILDVGQGDAILITLPGPQYILVDGGGSPWPGSSYDVGERLLVPALKAQGIDHLDMVIATHGHPDHIGGLFTLFKTIPVKQFLHNGGQSSLQKELLQLASAMHIPVKQIKSGNSVIYKDENSQLSAFLLPAPQVEGLGENNQSVLLRFTANGHSILLTGDNEQPAEALFMELLPAAFIQSQFLKVGHHGSRTATSQEWLDIIKPEAALISCGYKNSFGLPNDEVLDRLKARQTKIFRTDLLGAIRVTLSPTKANLEYASFKLP